ncbi:hypothetical protein B0H17DRAFT_358746 [Mycena rosella]|uniref:Uncharacterized protein n=1 Tax=Mycena rosella TaxID=1033263 RepID=A0AAD7G1Q4_MYCRO|nr:hypothetical protein B0H17DRAFT_358746 [Mycena rosella]
MSAYSLANSSIRLTSIIALNFNDTFLQSPKDFQLSHHVIAEICGDHNGSPDQHQQLTSPLVMNDGRYKRRPLFIHIPFSCPRMDRNYSTTPASSSLSRNPSNVSWATKIKGAIQVGHGFGDAIRGSLGATDLGPQRYTSSGEIAQRGRHEIAQGLARIKGVTTMLPPAPVYDRRHSYPIQQYEQPASSLGRRSASAHQNRPNPPTATSPFEKYYEQPYPAEQDHDPGFAGLGAGADAGRRKEGNDQIMPAFFVSPPPPAAALETPYPLLSRHQGPGTSRSSQVSSQHHAFPSVHYRSGVPPNLIPASPCNSIAPPLPPRNSLNVAPSDPTAITSSAHSPSVDSHHLSAPSSIRQNAPSDASSTGPQPSSNSRHSLSTLLDRTSKSIRFSKGKTKEKQPEGSKRGRIQSMFLASGRHTASRPSSPDRAPEEHSSEPRYHTRSAPPTPPPHRHESALETAGYDVLSYDAKDVYPHWPTEEEMRHARSPTRGGRLEPVRSVRV